MNFEPLSAWGAPLKEAVVGSMGSDEAVLGIQRRVVRRGGIVFVPGDLPAR